MSTGNILQPGPDILTWQGNADEQGCVLSLTANHGAQLCTFAQCLVGVLSFSEALMHKDRAKHAYHTLQMSRLYSSE